MATLATCRDKRLVKEATLAAALQNGNKGAKVKIAQELLCFHNRKVSTDGEFGDATEAAVRAFQTANSLPANGKVNQATMDALMQPLLRAVEADASPAGSLASQIVKVAKRHLKEHGIEIGGANAGPWVRLYMDGNQGPDWAWCAGFVSHIVAQACLDLNMKVPVKKTFSCDLLATDGQKRNIFVPAKAGTPPAPGWIFLLNRTVGDWTHTGLVVSAGSSSFTTIEGNTNDEGSREGFEVCSLTRAYGKYDFIQI